jgi:hypothetical protein
MDDAVFDSPSLEYPLYDTLIGVPDKENKNSNGIRYEYIALKIMQLFPDSSPREIERLLERMQDFGLLNEQGDQLKKLFWGYFWSEE